MKKQNAASLYYYETLYNITKSNYSKNDLINILFEKMQNMEKINNNVIIQCYYGLKLTLFQTYSYVVVFLFFVRNIP